MSGFQPVLELLRTKSATDISNAFADTFGAGKPLTLEQFSHIVRKALGLEAKEGDVKHLFCQVDRYCRGKIAAAEVNEYLAHYEKKRKMHHEGPFETTPTTFPAVRCQDSILDMVLVPDDPDTPSEIADHYVSLSRDGLVTVWTKDVAKKFETTVATAEDATTTKTAIWATSLACIPKEKLIAVSSTAGDIRFFWATTYKFDLKFSITNLPSVVLRLSYHPSGRLVYGEFTGRVSILNLGKAFLAHSRRRAPHLPPEKIGFENLRLGRVPGLSFEGTSKAHHSPVKQVEYIPSLDAVISCSTSSKRAMLIHFLESNESLGFRSEGGISCFTFYKRLNFVATGCLDHSIKIWNPLVNASFSEALIGHSSPVSHVLVNESRMFLVSTDHTKEVRVWDLVRPKCLQVIKLASHFPGRSLFSTVFLDPLTGTLILTTHRIGTLRLHHPPPRLKTHPDSEFLVLASYSRTFNHLITVGSAGSVGVWDVESGSLVNDFDRTHEVLDSDGLSQNLGITAACLDPSQRRLITADRLGTLKAWNFHLGLCLRTFQAGFVVHSLAFVGQTVYAAGSAGTVVTFQDDGGSEPGPPEPWEKRHQRSVVSLDAYGEALLASASCDGEIVVWLRRSVDPKFHLKDLEEEDSEEKQDQKITIDSDEPPKKNSSAAFFDEVRKRRRCSISQILFLQRRDLDFTVGNLVSCGMDGRVRFWNVVCTSKVNEGHLLSRFRAVFRSCDGVLCMATDSENRYLVTGDTMGYVRVYELDGYYTVFGCAPPRIQEEPSSENLAQFPFLKINRMLERNHPEHSKFPPGNGSEVGFVPFLLNCFRAHLKAVQRVSYEDGRNLLVTAGRDGSVRLWTLEGLHVGSLGPTDSPWDVAERGRCRMPADLRAAGSATTLFVLKGGTTPLWSRALESLRRCRLGHQPENYAKQKFRLKSEPPMPFEGQNQLGRSLDEELSERLSFFRGTKDCKQKWRGDHENTHTTCYEKKI